MSNALASLPPAALAFAAIVAAFAGFVRGFTGFGFALAAVPALTLVLDPVEVVPCVLLLQIVAGAQLLPTVWHEVDWSSLGFLLIGALVGTPVGTYLLAAVPADPMRAAIGAILLAAVLVLARGYTLDSPASRLFRLAIGALSGVLNAGTAMGGPPVILFFLAAARSVASGRASLLMYFFFLSIGSVAATAVAGLVSLQTLVLAGWMLPPLAVGNALGDRAFRRASARAYQRVALAVLATIAFASLVRALAF